MLEYLKKLAKIFDLNIEIEEGKEEAAIKAIADAADEALEKRGADKQMIADLQSTLSDLGEAVKAGKKSEEEKGGEKNTQTGMTLEEVQKQIADAKKEINDSIEEQQKKQKRQAEIEALGKKHGIKNEKYLNLFDYPDDGDVEDSFKKFKEESPDLFTDPKNTDLDNSNPGAKQGGEIDTSDMHGKDLVYAHYQNQKE